MSSSSRFLKRQTFRAVFVNAHPTLQGILALKIMLKAWAVNPKSVSYAGKQKLSDRAQLWRTGLKRANVCLTTAPPLPTSGRHGPHSKTPAPNTHAPSAQAGLGQGGGQRKMTGRTAASVFLYPSTSTLSTFKEIFTLLKTALMSETEKVPSTHQTHKAPDFTVGRKDSGLRQKLRTGRSYSSPFGPL